MFRFCYHITLVFIAVGVWAQPIAIDRGVKAGDVWCFPLASDSLSFYYLPSSAKLAINEQGLPKFTLLRYVINKPSSGEQSITDADGGAVLHFLMLYDTPEAALKKTENSLKKKAGDQAILKGPIVFKNARYTLVSSILNDKQYQVLSTGDAPVLENSTMAFSFELTPKDSKLLLESFKTGTSDVSIVLDFTFEGFTESFQAQLEVDWAKTHQTRDLQAGGSLNLKAFAIGGEVKDQIDKLIQNQAIKLTTIGSDAHLEALMNRVYGKIVDLLYEPLAPEKLPEIDKNSLGAQLGKSVSDGLKELEKHKPFSFNTTYKRKTTKTEGSAKYDFNGRSQVERHHFVTFNIANVYQKYSSNPLVFKDVSLYDVTFQQRQLSIGLDGEVERDFDKMLNNVTVIIRKTHQDSSLTLKEITLNKAMLQKGTVPTVSYLNQGDQDRLQWLQYEYQIKWQFIGGGSVVSDWLKSDSPIINLHLPYKRWRILLEGDLEKLKAQQISLITVQVNYQLGGQARNERIRITPQDNLETKILEVTLPADQNEVDYHITWVNKEGQQYRTTGKDKYGLLVIDNIPKQ